MLLMILIPILTLLLIDANKLKTWFCWLIGAKAIVVAAFVKI
jgi:hypothetical protein